MENNKQHLSSCDYSKALISKMQDQIVCKVKFSSFSDYESVCFLPNNFDELVKVFSKAFYPNDFIIIYINSKYTQVIVHSDSTYNDILSDVFNDNKQIREVKFQIILYNVNNEIEFNISKERINKNIKTIFETETAEFIEEAKELVNKEFNSQAIPSIYRSIEESRASKNRKKINERSFDYKNSEFSTSFSLSCKNFENLFIEDFEENYFNSTRKTINSVDNDSCNVYGTSKNGQNKLQKSNPNKIFGKSTKRYRNETPEEILEFNDRNSNRSGKNRNSNNKNPFNKNVVSCC